MKDTRLQRMCRSVKAAMNTGFTDGLSKVMVLKILDVVMEHLLCNDHRVMFTV